ncbi:MAG: hypothetical protein H0Z35_03960 [Thermoanaerobacteraceae bacterium]|nr:hypothetical protein [Thermoanaerobacteraceae bacterium]
MKPRRHRKAVQDFTYWMDRLEKYLIRVVVTGVILLVIVQAYIFQDSTRFYMSFSERLNQEVAKFYRQYPRARPTSSEVTAFATVTIRLVNFSTLQKARLLINDVEVTDFREKQVTVKVNPGDVISIDGSYYMHKLVFEVVGTSGNILYPQEGETIEVNGDVVSLRPVKLRKK